MGRRTRGNGGSHALWPCGGVLLPDLQISVQLDAPYLLNGWDITEPLLLSKVGRCLGALSAGRATRAAGMGVDGGVRCQAAAAAAPQQLLCGHGTDWEARVAFC